MKRVIVTSAAMRFRAASLAIVSFGLVAAVTAAGCRRSPFAPSADAAVDAPAGSPSVGDAAAHETIEIMTDAPIDATASGSPPADAPTSDDTRADDGAVADVPAETAPPDASTDVADNADVAPADALPDAVASDARPEDQPCGPLALSCAPFACDVAQGICKTHCATNADCVTGRQCNSVGLCGFKESTTCTANSECASGFCAQGICCATACAGPCKTCAWPGLSGTCTAVPRGVLDPSGMCGTAGTCNGRGGCVPATCVADSDCGELYWCTSGRCVACNATCASSPDCAVGAVCNMRNFCTYCYPADAGTLP